jgi:hypothetical protein
MPQRLPHRAIIGGKVLGDNHVGRPSVGGAPAIALGNIDVCQRFSFKLDFNRCDDGFRLDGLKQLNPHAMTGDPSKLRERLGYSLFRAMDVLAPRAVHARVYIYGECLGLSAVVVESDGRFTANRFLDAGDGNLHRDLWPTTVETSTTTVSNALRTNDEPGVMDGSDFLACKNAVAASTEANFVTQLAPYLDLDDLARYFVVDRAITNYDGSMALYYGLGWGPASGRHFWYGVGGGSSRSLPGTSTRPAGTRNRTSGPTTPPMGSMSFRTGMWSPTTATATRATSTTPGSNAALPRRVRTTCARSTAILAGPFSEESVTAKLETWRAQIADTMGEDPLVDAAQWQTSVDDLRANLPKLQGNLRLMMSGLITE